MNTKRTDTQLLDGLQDLLGVYIRKVCCRWSATGRGWRLHESSEGKTTHVRKAIGQFLDSNDKLKEANHRVCP